MAPGATAKGMKKQYNENVGKQKEMENNKDKEKEKVAPGAK